MWCGMHGYNVTFCMSVIETGFSIILLGFLLIATLHPNYFRNPAWPGTWMLMTYRVSCCNFVQHLNIPLNYLSILFSSMRCYTRSISTVPFHCSSLADNTTVQCCSRIPMCCCRRLMTSPSTRCPSCWSRVGWRCRLTLLEKKSTKWQTVIVVLRFSFYIQAHFTVYCVISCNCTN